MKKINIKLRYLAGVTLFVLAWTAYLHTTDTVGLVRSASANQAFNTPPLQLPGDGLDLVAFSSDGSTLASADSDGQILLWDVSSGQIRVTLPSRLSGPVHGIVFSPDGNTLASVSDSAIRLWDVASGDTRLTLPESSLVNHLEFSPDGKTLATVNQDARLTLWDSQSGSNTPVLTVSQSKISAIAFSPDSATLSVGSQDAKIKLLNSVTGLEQASLPTTVGAAVTDLLFSSDGKTLAAVGQDGRITLWDPQSDTTTHVLTGHQSSVNAIAFSPDSKMLASGDKDARIKLWDRSTGLEQASLSAEGAVTGLVFSQNGKTIASVGESEPVFLWDVSTTIPQLLTGQSDWVDKIIFSSNQQTLASVGKTGQVVVWDLKTGLEQLAFQVPLFGSAGLSSQVASGNSGNNNTLTAGVGVVLPNVISQTANAPVVIQSAASTTIKKSNHDWKGVTALTISPDGSLFGGATKDGLVRLWTSTGKENFAISEHHGTAVAGVAFTSDGKHLIIAGRDTEIQIRDALSGKKETTLFAQEHPIRTLAASPDGKYFASGGEETRIMLWDATSNKLVKIFSGHTDFVNAVSFSTDGTYLASASADGRILLWDIKTGKIAQTLAGHSGEVNAVAFSKDGKFLASGGADSLVILWDTATGQQIQSFSGHEASVRAVAFNPANSQQLASTGEDSKILVWNTATPKLTSQITNSVSGITGSVSLINTLVFNPSGQLVSGSENGDITEWDVATGQKQQIINLTVQPLSSNFEAITAEPTRSNTAKTAQTNSLSSVLNRVLDWIIPSAEAALPDPNQGPGGPILIVTTSSDPFGKYYAEILRTEGFNEFTVADISTINAATLTSYDMVILARMTLSANQVTILTNWVTAGGNLLVMRPDAQLAGLLGVTATGTTVSNGYLLVDTTKAPGNGIVKQTIQFHGVADRYTVTSASSLAALYTNATTTTANPAVTLRNVGVSGGQAAAFTYDLATSTVYTR